VSKSFLTLNADEKPNASLHRSTSFRTKKLCSAAAKAPSDSCCNQNFNGSFVPYYFFIPWNWFSF
jgi:hypothetical protein